MILYIHPDDPQPRLITQVTASIRRGDVVIYPTDTGYALGCHIGDKKALDRVRQIRHLDEKHLLTLLCRDLSELGTYAQVSNAAYRQLKSLTPGPYTFILNGTRDVPRRLLHKKRKTIGIRVPDNAICQALLSELQEPILSTTLILDEEETMPYHDPQHIADVLGHQVDIIVDSGPLPAEQTTVIDWVEKEPVVVRQGKGEI